MVMFDTLSRRMLSPYGNSDVYTPNFKRLEKKTVTFDQSWVGSMPCMPARRELHTGRYNFLHRSWGPLEPFDDSMPEILSKNGIYTHLVTDHNHYFKDGGSTYHTRYSSYEFVRGQEGDFWKGEVADPYIPDYIGGHHVKEVMKHEFINRKYMSEVEDFPQVKTFQYGLEFIEKNYKEDHWFLQIECFDPHEPFNVPEKFLEMYSDNDYDGPHFDWPSYGRVSETREQVEQCRNYYKALITMCDESLGKVLDKMDELDLWKDTMLIVNTDHGLLMGEHDWWGKCVQPFYNEVARTPLFIWDPRSKRKGVRSQSLVQIIDLAPTLLDFFNVEIPKNMQGKPLREVINHDESVREALLFGIHGGHINCTNGRYVYMHGPQSPENQPLFNYTLMPTHIRGFFELDELKDAQLSMPFSFTKGLRTLQVNAGGKMGDRPVDMTVLKTMLFDIENDPEQKQTIENPEIKEKMMDYLIALMDQSDAPPEQYLRLGLKGKDPETNQEKL